METIDASYFPTKFGCYRSRNAEGERMASWGELKAINSLTLRENE